MIGVKFQLIWKKIKWGLFNSNVKKPYIFYLDKDEKYQYLIKESFKSTHQLKLLSSEDAISMN